MDTNLTTYQDVVDDLLDYFGEDYDRRAKRNARRAAGDAYRTLTTRHHWSIYDTIGRVATVAPYATGSIAYDHTGGASERLVTLTDGAFPESWSAYGVLLIDSRPYHVQTWIDATHLTLTAALNPGADVDAGTSYSLYRDTYPLPVNVRSLGQLRDVVNGYKPRFVYPDDWLEVVRGFTTTSCPTHYTLIGEPENYSSMAVRFAPAPDAEYIYDFSCHRGLAALRTLNDAAGTVSTSTTTVTASTAVFADRHVGCAIRFGDTTDEPTGFGGEHPYVAQRTVTAVTDSTHATIDAALDTEVTSVYWSLSDILDIETDAMFNALLAEARAAFMERMSRGRLTVDKDLIASARNLRSLAIDKYLLAKAADDKSEAAMPFGDSSAQLPSPRPFSVTGGS